MTQRMQDLADQIVKLQSELDREIALRRKVLGWRLNKRMIEFEHGITLEHRRLRESATRFLLKSSILAYLSAPVIYSMIIPFALIDGWASFYQAICFRLYGLPRVRRSNYIMFDRRHLAYLNWIEALNCVYCGYANGVIAYVREIGSRTEQYWCPIKHALRISDPHRRYYEFLEYGDAEGYRSRLDTFRERLRQEVPTSSSPWDVETLKPETKP
ncbi:MAG: hypothetical protein P4L76_01590 [Beijerinckiaceae bacterium]|nr:hypothetical protein [Beijerinckiaceae bacterium]